MRAARCLAAALWFLGACAKQAPPPGGPEDRVAPALERVDPPAGSSGVPRSQPVRLTFTKSMQRSEVEGALHFFPAPPSPPELHWDGLELVIRPDTAWDSGQTYILTLQGDATDVRGNRLVSTFQTAFSTGTHIDSGSIAGQVLRNARPAPGVLALCYSLLRGGENPELDTADYVVQSDSAGRFLFSYLGPGPYRVFGLDDRDRDWLWNIGTEDVAVPALDVLLDKGETAFLPALHLTPLDTIQPSLLDCELLSDTWLRLHFDSGIDSTQLDSVSVEFQRRTDTVKNLRLLQPDSSSDAVLVEFPPRTAGGEGREMVWRHVHGTRPDEVCATDSVSLGPANEPLAPPRFRPDTALVWPHPPEHISLWFEEPLDSVIPGAFARWPGPLVLPARLAHPFEVVVSLSADSLWGDSVRLVVAPGAVRAAAGKVWPEVDTIFVTLPVVPGDSSGSYEISLEGIPETASQMVRSTIRPLNDTTLTVVTALAAGKNPIGRLAQGDYQVWLLADADGNGRWCTGWPSPYRPSERLWFPQDTLRVRARFTTEFSLSLVR